MNDAQALHYLVVDKGLTLKEAEEKIKEMKGCL